jgi:hypothetical protein
MSDDDDDDDDDDDNNNNNNLYSMYTQFKQLHFRSALTYQKLIKTLSLMYKCCYVVKYGPTLYVTGHTLPPHKITVPKLNGYNIF